MKHVKAYILCKCGEKISFTLDVAAFPFPKDLQLILNCTFCDLQITTTDSTRIAIICYKDNNQLAIFESKEDEKVYDQNFN